MGDRKTKKGHEIKKKWRYACTEIILIPMENMETGFDYFGTANATSLRKFGRKDYMESLS